ncbi:MAG TPA: hypothetical protein VFO38_00445 [Candidatus Saccharimonadales bacterium]|nr:hypothetical protein [Candidatus Saccharimonadales bacterium]
MIEKLCPLWAEAVNNLLGTPKGLRGEIGKSKPFQVPGTEITGYVEATKTDMNQFDVSLFCSDPSVLKNTERMRRLLAWDLCGSFWSLRLQENRVVLERYNNLPAQPLIDWVKILEELLKTAADTPAGEAVELTKPFSLYHAYGELMLVRRRGEVGFACQIIANTRAGNVWSELSATAAVKMGLLGRYNVVSIPSSTWSLISMVLLPL